MLDSAWMNYEVGAARILEKRIVPVSTELIDDLGRYVISEDSVLNMTWEPRHPINLEKTITFLSKIFTNPELDESSYTSEKECIENHLESWFTTKNGKRSLYKFYKGLFKRCVYIVGSRPNNDRTWNQESVTQIVGTLTTELISRGFQLASFPGVETMGKIVAVSCVQSPKDYQIAGLHKLESSLKNIIQSDSDFHDAIAEYRKTYLHNVDIILVMGGNKNTEAEYKVALAMHILTIPIPCFGGFGRKLFSELKYSNSDALKHHPCKDCIFKNGDYAGCDKIREIPLRLAELKGFKDIYR